MKRTRTYENLLTIISSIMDEEGISRSDLSRRLSVSSSAVTQMFNNHTNVSLAKAERLAEAVGGRLEVEVVREEEE